MTPGAFLRRKKGAQRIATEVWDGLSSAEKFELFSVLKAALGSEEHQAAASVVDGLIARGLFDASRRASTWGLFVVSEAAARSAAAAGGAR